MNVTIDDSKDKLTDCFGFTEEEFENFAEKASNIAKSIIDVMTGKSEEDLSKTQVADRIQKELSDKEILLLATEKISQDAENVVKMMAFKSALEDMAKEASDSEDKEEIGEEE